MNIPAVCARKRGRLPTAMLLHFNINNQIGRGGGGVHEMNTYQPVPAGPRVLCAAR